MAADRSVRAKSVELNSRSVHQRCLLRAMHGVVPFLTFRSAASRACGCHHRGAGQRRASHPDCEGQDCDMEAAQRASTYPT